MQSKGHGYFGLISSVLLLGLTAFAWIQRDMVFDMWRLRGYEPSAAVVALANDTRMTPDMRRLFYVYHPSLYDKETFNKHCTDSEQTIVLGCYISARGIYLYDVTDARLHGVEQVTAAHESLHAAYERLNAREKKRVDAMVAAAFAQVNDDRIKTTVENYRKKDATVVPNELHSILATEVRNLPADLEAYYRQYFSDRSAIVAFSEKYESEFTSREQQREDYDEQLAVLKQQIDNLSANLTQRERQITSAYEELLALKQKGQTQEYNARVPGYNNEVNAYNAEVSRARALIKQYNEIVEKRNALVVEEGELLQAIDSRPETIQAQ